MELRSPTGIFQFIEQKAKELRTTPEGAILIHNHVAIDMMNSGYRNVQNAIDQGKNKALDILGGLGGLGGLGELGGLGGLGELGGLDKSHKLKALNLNEQNIRRDMETKIASSPTKVTLQMLTDMAEEIVCNKMVDRLIFDFIDEVHEGKKLTPEEKNNLASDFMKYPQAEALLNASTPEAAADLAAIMKRGVALDFLIDKDCRALKDELLNAGLEDFCHDTRLTAEEGKMLNTKSLEDEMDSVRKELDRSRLEANPKLYRRAGRDELKAQWEKMSREFFINRVDTYRDVGGPSMSQADKEAWLRAE